MGVDLVGRSTNTRDTTVNCMECCSSNYCNYDLCEHKTRMCILTYFSLIWRVNVCPSYKHFEDL